MRLLLVCDSYNIQYVKNRPSLHFWSIFSRFSFKYLPSSTGGWIWTHNFLIKASDHNHSTSARTLQFFTYVGS